MTQSKQALEYAAKMHRLGGEVRATPTLPMRLLIFDQQIAIMPMDPANPTAGAVIHRSPAVVSLTLALFDAYWSRATELFSPDDREDDAPLTPHEAEVLRLLAERLDAASRFELGVAAAKRGWV